MWQLKSGKSFLLGSLLLVNLVCWSQDAIKNVQIEKVTATQFRIRYQLNTTSGYEFSIITAKIFRKRSGKIEEVFSEDITPYNSNQTGPSYVYHWITEPGIIKDGDELQAKIMLSYNRTAIVKPSTRANENLPPTANAGNFMEVQLPVPIPLTLNGSKSSDRDGKIIAYSWKQIGGPTTVIITQQNNGLAHVTGPVKEGSYAFELTVKDQYGAIAKDRIIVTVKPAEVLAPPPPVAEIKTIKKDTLLNQPIAVSKKMDKLKGGPSNALLNILVPGLGHYFVSGDHHGKGRKKGVLAITALYAGTVGGSIYFLSKSDQQFEKYKALSNFREYQRDNNGTVIGVRGGNEEEAKRFLDEGKSAQKNARIFLGVGAGILTIDFVYTLLKGIRNQSNWKKEAAGQAGFFISSNGTQMTAGVRIKL